MGRFVSTFASILSLMIFPALVRADEPTTAPAVYATPADVLAAAVKAGRGADFETYVNCQSPDCQANMIKFAIRMLVAAPTTAPSTSDSDKDKAAFEAKWGLDHRDLRPGETDAQLVDRLAQQIPNKPAFLIELMSLERSHDKLDPNANPMPELTNILIELDGTTAVGKLVSHSPNGGTMSMDIRFKKIDGFWKIDSMMFF